ncbi:MAG: ThiF family adenylyltransferase, partial [Clostridia bacterium]|nr:ThiF family adenylyltransferase [Clostridia bacterium]
VGKITVCDGDVFGVSNLNRQILCTEDDLGKSKALQAADRIMSVNSGVEVGCFDEFMTNENVSEIISGCDIVFDALDDISARKILAKACERYNVPYIYGAISGWAFQAAVCLPGSGLIEKLFPEHVEITDKSVLAFTPSMCASFQVSLGLKVLLGREVEPSRVYYVDLLFSETECIDF